MNKLAIYLRLSIEDYQKKEESESIHNQREYIKAYIKKHNDLMGYEILEYVDDGFSGTNPNRPAYQRLINDVKNNQIDGIIVKDMSRFSRDYIEMGNYLENIFPFMGIRFISINDGYDSLKEGSNGTEIDTQFKSLLYDFYSKELSQKIRDISQELKSQGKNTNGLAPFGYLKDPNDKYHIIVDEETAFIVKEAFELILQGYSCRKIARIFNEKGYITRSERKEELGITSYKKSLKTGTEVKKRMWQGMTIAQMTSMELYTGNYVYNQIKETHIGGRKSERLPKEEWKRVENTHEPIISKDVFDKVQETKQQNIGKSFKKSSNKKKYFGIFGGKIFCKECGRKLFYREGSKKTRNGISEYKAYYCDFCKANQNSNIIKEKKLEELLLDKIKNMPIKVDKGTTKLPVRGKNNHSYELESINSSLQKEYEKYKRKEILKEVYLQEKQKLLLKKQELEQGLEKESIFKSANEIPDLSDNGKITKEIVDTMVEKIVVSRYGNIEIYLRKQ
jgi:putative conjugative transposon site-specific recombinase